MRRRIKNYKNCNRLINNMNKFKSKKGQLFKTFKKRNNNWFNNLMKPKQNQDNYKKLL